MRYHEIKLTEAVRANELYHGTTCEALYDILENDCIESKTGFPQTHNAVRDWAIRPSDVSQNGYITGVSTTRNQAFAKRWMARVPSWSKTKEPQIGCMLVLDANVLRQNYRVIPISFWTGRNAKMSGVLPGSTDESEEFVVGQIKPLRPILKSVLISKANLSATLVPFACEEYGIKLITF